MFDELFTIMIKEGFMGFNQPNLTLGIVNSVLLELDWNVYLAIHRN